MGLPVISGVARLLDDPELRFAASGTAVATVRLAFNSRKRDENGTWVDSDSFFVDGKVFSQEAENVAESLTRGMEVSVTGRLKTRRYETKDGEKRSVTEMVIDGIGPSLKRATATVNKASRSGGNGGGSFGGGQPAGDDAWSTPPAAGGSSSFDEAPPF